MFRNVALREVLRRIATAAYRGCDEIVVVYRLLRAKQMFRRSDLS
jgi:hypothetical protein